MEETMSNDNNETLTFFETTETTRAHLVNYTEGQILDAILDLANTEALDGELSATRKRYISWCVAEVLRRRLEEHQQNRPEHEWMSTKPSPDGYSDSDLLYTIDVLATQEFHSNGLSPSDDNYLVALLHEAAHRGIDDQVRFYLMDRITR
jgi:hypothetical protein